VEREWLLIASFVLALITPQLIVHGLLILFHPSSSIQIEAHGISLPSTTLTMANVDVESVWHGTISSILVVLFLIVHLNSPVHIASTTLVFYIKDIKQDSVLIKPKKIILTVDS